MVTERIINALQTPDNPPESLSVETWVFRRVHRPGSPEAYAAFVLAWRTTPAMWQNMSRQWMEKYTLFADWKGVRVRVTGASRLGDVWVTRDLTREHGYDDDGRINILDLSNWGPNP